MEERAINYSLEEMRRKRRQKLREEFSLSPSPINRPYIPNFYQQKTQQRCTQNDHQRNDLTTKNFKQQQEPQRQKFQQKLHRIGQNYSLAVEKQKNLAKNRLKNNIPELLTTKCSDIIFDQYNQFTILM